MRSRAGLELRMLVVHLLLQRMNRGKVLHRELLSVLRTLQLSLRRKDVHLLLYARHGLHDVQHLLVMSLMFDYDVVHLVVRYTRACVLLIMNEGTRRTPLASFRTVEELAWVRLWSSVEVPWRSC